MEGEKWDGNEEDVRVKGGFVLRLEMVTGMDLYTEDDDPVERETVDYRE